MQLRATAVAQEQYKSLLTGLQAVGQVRGWKVQQIVFSRHPRCWREPLICSWLSVVIYCHER
jgi:hypothetical protein